MMFSFNGIETIAATTGINERCIRDLIRDYDVTSFFRLV